MKNKWLILSLVVTHTAFAGINGLTWHSRANCVNNESVTWDYMGYHQMGTIGQHYSKSGQWIHGISTGWENTWRSTAVHFNEAKVANTWRVMGYHWIMENKQQRMLGQTDVVDCSVYDGWWDKNKPKKEFPIETVATNYTPQPISGVQIIPSSAIDYPAEVKQTQAMQRKQFTEQGFVESNLPNPLNLMNIKQRAPAAAPSKMADAHHYYLRKDAADIKLSFSYKGISDENNRIGFAPVGTYIKEGWTGIREFFEDKEWGICSLTTYHLTDSRMGIKISADDVSYAVNHYPTTLSVEGSKKTGFIYSVSWIDSTYSKDLQCAKKIFDKELENKLVAYANSIA